MIQSREITLLQSARCLSLDRAAGGVAGRLAETGIDAMLVKGAAAVRQLYDDGGPRRYSDCDLLVRERDVARAGAILTGLGFERAYDEETCIAPDEFHAHNWVRRGDRAAIDLHWTFIGFTGSPDVVFDTLWSSGRREWIGGREVAVPSPGATALLAALQLLMHGRQQGAKHRGDMERALERLDSEHWEEAARIARLVGGAPRFGAALRLTPAGVAMAERLGLADEPLTRAIAEQPSHAYATRWFERVAKTPGLRGKARLLRWLVFPPRSYLVFVHPSARRGGVRLALIYVLRPLRLLARAPRVIGTWRRAHRESHG